LNRVLNETGVLRTGDNLQYHCPFCHHYKRKLEICLNPPNLWNCWTCSTRGKGIYWLLKKLKAPQSTIDELEKIIGYPKDYSRNFDFNKPFISFDAPKDDTVETELLLPEGFRSLAYNDGTREYKVALNYARKRKINTVDIIKYNIGHCEIGEYRERLVFPSYDKENRLNFFSTRSYYDDSLFKYVNSPVSKNIIGFENMVDFDYPIYLCEGALDAISLRRNAVPLFGKTLSNKLKIAIIKSKCPEINIVLDDDALDSALRIAQFIKSIGKVAKLIRLEGKDPNVLGFEKTITQMRNVQRLDFGEEMRLRLGV
jgi:hypothetical protein